MRKKEIVKEINAKMDEMVSNAPIDDKFYTVSQLTPILRAVRDVYDKEYKKFRTLSLNHPESYWTNGLVMTPELKEFKIYRANKRALNKALKKIKYNVLEV